MDNIWGTQLAYTPEYWPYWLILAGMLVVAVLGALALHGLLRMILRPKATSGPEHRTYLYSGVIRLWHWCNALLFILLLLSGILNHFSIGPTAQLVTLHEICGYALIVVWFAFVFANAITGNARHYRIKFKGWISRCFKQVYFYLIGIMKGDSHPFPASEESKFNPIQQVAYLGVMYGMLPLLIVTGLVSLYPSLLGYAHWGFVAHQVMAIISMMFIFVHIYLCTTGDTVTQTFKSMVDGYHRHCGH